MESTLSHEPHWSVAISPRQQFSQPGYIRWLDPSRLCSFDS